MQIPETPTENEIILQAKRNCDGFYNVNTLLEALESFYMSGFQDEVCGTVESGCHYYRVSRWIVQTDSQGFHEVFNYETPQEAGIEFGKIQFGLDSEENEDEVMQQDNPLGMWGRNSGYHRITFFSR